MRLDLGPEYKSSGQTNNVHDEVAKRAKRVLLLLNRCRVNIASLDLYFNLLIRIVVPNKL